MSMCVLVSACESVWVCLGVCGVCSACRGHMRLSDLLELELETAGRCLTWVLEWEPRSPGGIARVFNLCVLSIDFYSGS